MRINKTCKYCQTPLLDSKRSKEMCRPCFKTHLLEYNRLYKSYVRRDNVFELFEFHKCVVCNSKITFGSKICDACMDRRNLIRKVLIKEFGKQFSEVNNGK